ncbi:hypothetical protein LROSL1_0155 [Furfurilactobacillus rossiae]|nr:hypothetical protein LROSL1_0155 [Furfurilactobacillus rossiae]
MSNIALQVLRIPLNLKLTHSQNFRNRSAYINAHSQIGLMSQPFGGYFNLSLGLLFPLAGVYLNQKFKVWIELNGHDPLIVNSCCTGEKVMPSLAFA